MDNQVTQKPEVTYEDKVAETILLAQRLPVGSYWRDDTHIYKVNRLELADIASAKCTKITLPGFKSPVCTYDYMIQEYTMFISDIPHLIEADESDFTGAIENIGKMYDAKNNELFQKQCLMVTPTDTPFTEFDILHDEIIELQGKQYFFYEPAPNCFRIFAIDMQEYNGKDTKIKDWHFYMNSDDSGTQILSVQRDDISLVVIVSTNRVFPITEFQFEMLREFIDNNPNKTIA